MRAVHPHRAAEYGLTGYQCERDLMSQAEATCCSMETSKVPGGSKNRRSCLLLCSTTGSVVTVKASMLYLEHFPHKEI